MRQLKRHLTVANVLSCTALFIALGGVTYAATLGNKSVKTKNLANGAVTAKKLRGGAVTTPKLRNGAVVASKVGAGAIGTTQLADGGVRSADLGGGVVTTPKLKDGAVTGAKMASEAVATSQLKDGAVTGAKLAPNFLAQLVKNVSYPTETSVSDASDAKGPISAECVSGPTRKQVVGGGARINGSSKVALTESAPKIDAAGNRVGWTASAREIEAETENWSLQVYAICAEF